MNKNLKNIVHLSVIPGVMYIVLKILSMNFGDQRFATGSDLSTIIYTAIYTCMIALAMAINLYSGRFDFSSGAVLVVSAIVGGNFAKEHGYGPLGLILSIVIVGMILGTVSGIVYVSLKLPPMISSLGMTMIYEAISLLVNKSKGIKMIGQFNVLIFSNQKYLLLLLLLVVLVCSYTFYMTRFGYNYRALSSGQKIAVETGINEKRNAIVVYAIAGGLIGISATIFLSKYGFVSPEAGLGSSTYFMGAFLPIFIGGFLSRYSNMIIGVMIGSFCQAMLSSGLVSLGLSNSQQTLINGLFVVGFLIFTTNSYKLLIRKMHKQKLAKALT